MAYSESEFALVLRSRIAFDFNENRYTNARTHIPVIYEPCDCQEKYSFKPQSRLLAYLRQCKGWTDDPEGKYTLNYIIAVLLAYAKEQNFFCICVKDPNKRIIGDSRFKAALGVSSITFRELRSLIANAHLNFGRPVFNCCPPFACKNKIGKRTQRLIYSLTGKPHSKTAIIANRSWRSSPHGNSLLGESPFLYAYVFE
jgi:hypothetical protein